MRMKSIVCNTAETCLLKSRLLVCGQLERMMDGSLRDLSRMARCWRGWTGFSTYRGFERKFKTATPRTVQAAGHRSGGEALRLMMVGLLSGIVHDRRPTREAQVTSRSVGLQAIASTTLIPQGGNPRSKSECCLTASE